MPLLASRNELTRKLVNYERAEKIALKAQEYAESIVESVHNPLLVLDTDLRIISATNLFHKTFQVTPEETLGQLIYDLDNGQWDFPRLRDLLETILPESNSFEDFEVEHDFKNIGQRTLLLRGRRLYSEKNDSELIFLCIEDITDRRIAEEVARATKEFAENIIQTVREPLLVLDSDLRVVSASRPFYNTYQVTPEETVGHLVYNLGNHQWDIPRLRELLEEILPERNTFDDYEVEHDFETIGQRTMLLNSRRIYKPGNNSQLILLAIEDITERKLIEARRLVEEARLQQIQKLVSIGTLASGVAHEINNPLMGLMNYAELVKDRAKDATSLEYLTEIGIEGNRIARIVRNLLSFSRQDTEEHSSTDIKDIIDGSMCLVGSTLRKDQISIQLDIAEDLPQLKCRSQQIQQVLINLLTNAHDALVARYPNYDDNKLVRITARLFQREGEDWIRTTIEDHGTGISEDVAQHIFDPFFTTKPKDKGTGLGLSVSFGIVREHHGELTVVSVLGEFTRFHMDLRVNNGWSDMTARKENA
jgi:PAS domain S-box-containing protein